MTRHNGTVAIIDKQNRKATGKSPWSGQQKQSMWWMGMGGSLNIFTRSKHSQNISMSDIHDIYKLNILVQVLSKSIKK